MENVFEKCWENTKSLPISIHLVHVQGSALNVCKP